MNFYKLRLPLLISTFLFVLITLPNSGWAQETDSTLPLIAPGTLGDYGFEMNEMMEDLEYLEDEIKKVTDLIADLTLQNKALSDDERKEFERLKNQLKEYKNEKAEIEKDLEKMRAEYNKLRKGFVQIWAGGGKQNLIDTLGQGVAKHSDGTDSRNNSIDDVQMRYLGIRLDFGLFYGSYENGSGDSDQSVTVGPGKNGELYLGINKNGFNGRLLPEGFLATDMIKMELDTNRLKFGYKYPGSKPEKNIDFELYGFWEGGELDVHSIWQAKDFPIFHSETEHMTEWDSFGVGLDLGIPPYKTSGGKLDIWAKPGAWVGRGNFKYRGMQYVFSNSEIPDYELYNEDEQKKVVWGADIEIGIDWHLAPNLRASLFGGFGTRTMPGLDTATGEELSQGQQDSLKTEQQEYYNYGLRLSLGF